MIEARYFVRCKMNNKILLPFSARVALFSLSPMLTSSSHAERLRANFLDTHPAVNSTPSMNSARVRRKPSNANRRRAGSQMQEGHDPALNAIRSFLKGRTCYDVFPVSFRLIVLDTRLNVNKALQSLLSNGTDPRPISLTLV
jgi:hypothetical protein